MIFVILGENWILGTGPLPVQLMHAGFAMRFLKKAPPPEALLPLPQLQVGEPQSVSLERYRLEFGRAIDIAYDTFDDMEAINTRYGRAREAEQSTLRPRSRKKQTDTDFVWFSERLQHRSADLEGGFFSFQPPDPRLSEFHELVRQYIRLDLSMSYYELAVRMHLLRQEIEKSDAFVDAVMGDQAQYHEVTRKLFDCIERLTNEHPEFMTNLDLPQRFIRHIQRIRQFRERVISSILNQNSAVQVDQPGTVEQSTDASTDCADPAEQP